MYLDKDGFALSREVADWFAGLPRPPRHSPVPMRAMAFPGYALLPEWWLAWSAEHPGAAPPVGREWLADPTDSRHRIRPEILETAQRCYRR